MKTRIVLMIRVQHFRVDAAEGAWVGIDDVYRRVDG